MFGPPGTGKEEGLYTIFQNGYWVNSWIPNTNQWNIVLLETPYAR